MGPEKENVSTEQWLEMTAAPFRAHSADLEMPVGAGSPTPAVPASMRRSLSAIHRKSPLSAFRMSSEKKARRATLSPRPNGADQPMDSAGRSNLHKMGRRSGGFSGTKLTYDVPAGTGKSPLALDKESAAGTEMSSQDPARGDTEGEAVAKNLTAELNSPEVAMDDEYQEEDDGAYFDENAGRKHVPKQITEAEIMAARVFKSLALLQQSGGTDGDPEDEPDPTTVLYEGGLTAEEIMKAAWDGADLIDDFPVYCDANDGYYYATTGCMTLHCDVE